MLNSAEIAGMARMQGFELAGVAGVGPSQRLRGFADWIASGRAGKMDYLARRNEAGQYLREAITAAWPWARSVICVALNYNTAHPRSTDLHDPDRGWISRYAWGADYHDILRAKLERLAAQIRDAAGEAEIKLTVDTAPVVEREAAFAAGLGWLGKNTCLIHPRKGSHLFLGCLVTSLELAPDAALPDRCGSCTRCIEACPTQALTPYQMDASRCLAYLNIELRGSVPVEFRSALGNNILGCDICQDVCPWNSSNNGRKAPATSVPEFEPRPGLFAPLLEELAAMTEDDYRARFRGSAVKRAKFSGLRRNLALAMGNSGNPRFIPRLQSWSGDPDPVLRESATWALGRIEAAAHEEK